MAIKRNIWKDPFIKDNVPSWPCPTCRKGTLIGDTKHIKVIESIESKKDRDEYDWEFEWIHGTFGGTLICDNAKCQEKVLVIGKMGVDSGYEFDEKEGKDRPGYFEYLTPLFFAPTINVFNVHDEVPRDIRNAIVESFNVYWVDVSACANKIRTILEMLMDFFKVKKSHIEKGKRKNYTLHNRIEFFKAQKNYEADYLMAIKWIGNSGSHGNDGLKTDDILDAYEILDHVLVRLFEKDSHRLGKITRTINKRRKPNSTRIKRRRKGKGGLF